MDTRTISNTVRIAGLAAGSLLRGGRAPAVRRLIESLASIPGAPAKISQALARRMGIDPADLAAPPARLDLAAVTAILRSEAPDLADRIAGIDPEPMTASMAQVHRISLKDGRRLVAKILHPGVAADLSGQLAWIGRLAGLAPPLRASGFAAEDWQNDLGARLLAETDLRLEASQQQWFADRFRGHRELIIPAVHHEWCTASLLVQDDVPSRPLSAARSLAPADRARLAAALAGFFVEPLLRAGRVHADLQTGNRGLIVEGRPAVVIYDFGSVLTPPAPCLPALRRLFHEDLGNPVAALSVLSQLGFDTKRLVGIANSLPELCAILREPVRALAGPGWRPDAWRVGPRAAQLLGADAWTFRLAGPPWFLWLMRAAVAATQALVDLETEVRLPIWAGGGAAETADTAARTDTADPQGVLPPPLPDTKLRISVTEGRLEIVSLEMPATAAAHLADLMPESALAVARAKGVDLAALEKRAKDTNFRAQDLYLDESGVRGVRIWLA